MNPHYIISLKEIIQIWSTWKSVMQDKAFKISKKWMAKYKDNQRERSNSDKYCPPIWKESTKDWATTLHLQKVEV